MDNDFLSTSVDNYDTVEVENGLKMVWPREENGGK